MIHYLTLDMRNFDLTNEAQMTFVKQYMSKSVDLFKTFYAENNNYGKYRENFDEENLLDLIKQWACTKTFVFLALWNDKLNILSTEKVVGIYVLQMNMSIVKRALVGEELFLMVDPNFAGHWIGPRLLKMGVKKAKELNCLWVDNFNTLGFKTEKMGKLYKTVGGEEIGRIYRTEIE